LKGKNVSKEMGKFNFTIDQLNNHKNSTVSRKNKSIKTIMDQKISRPKIFRLNTVEF
jgi:hypothetical protein